MIYDVYDYNFLRLCGLCRYFPKDLQERYKSEMLGVNVYKNLQEFKMIKQQSNKQSFKLTRQGKAFLAEMGYSFPEDVKTSINRQSYGVKINNAKWVSLLHIAGINVFCRNLQELAGIEVGYISTHLLRDDSNRKSLAETKFLGLLKIRDTVYIPYYVESADDWILQRFDRQMYEMFINELEGVKHVGHILLGETLEELSEYVIKPNRSEKLPRGRIPFSEALERFEGDTVFMPLNTLGVLQMQFLKNSRNNMRFVKMLDYDAVSLPAYSLFHCEKPNGTPIFIACDGNISKLKKALCQAEKAGYKFNPNIFALNKEQEDFIVNYIEKTTGKYYVCHRLTERIVKNKLFENLDTPIQRQAVEKDGVTFPVKVLKR